jgi:starch synthase
MKITIVTSEAVPYVKTGGLGDVITALGKELNKMGHEVTVMMPLYAGMSLLPTALISPLHLTFAGRHVTYSVVESRHEGIRFVFIDAPTYFHRPGVYGQGGTDYPDNDERFTFFNRACIEYYTRKDERPDVFHCNDWPTGPLPLFLRTHYYHDDVSRTPVLFTIHNIAYQGNFPADRFGLLELGWEYYTDQAVEFYGTVSFLKTGIVYADLITTVSQRYSKEIQTAEFGYRMEGILASRADDLFGVLNGIDDEEWNPAADPHIAQNYSVQDLSGKTACRTELLSFAGWEHENSTMPIIGIISRLTAQKGFDLLEPVGQRLLNLNLRLVVLGTGERRFEQFFERLRDIRPQQVAVAFRFDNVLAHKIEAGADMFLMPSRYEPCGLNQMYSLRYGTVPIVRATGGLDDTVQQWNSETRQGNGFKFHEYSADALLASVVNARNAFDSKDAWTQLMFNGMKGVYSWKNSAKQYLELYQKAIQLKS